VATSAALSVRVSANIGDFEKAMSSLERSLSTTGSRLQSVGTKLTTGLTLPIIAAAGGAIKAAADFEDAFAGVAKTVDGVSDSRGTLTAFGKALQQQFRDLAKIIPVSVSELAKIGEVAGAMGIPRERILQFTEVMAKLGATTDLTSDQAAASIGKIQNVYQSAGVDTDRFAASLVALGNAGASTESQIVAFAERMGGAAVQARVSQAEVLGWSNAMASVGLNAELGSTAWNKVLSSIGKAVDLGKSGGFAEVAGMTEKAFASLFKTDASEALNRIVEGFARIGASGGNLTAVMESLGLKTSGIQMTFKNLAASGDMVRTSLELGKKAWQDNIAMEEEFTKKSATAISQLKILFNNLYDVGIALGQQLLPHLMAMLPAAQSLIGVLSGLVGMFAALPSPVQAVVLGILAFGAALGPVIFAIGNIISAGGALIGFFRMLSGASVLGAVAPTAAGATAAISGFAAAALAIPGVQIAAAVVGIAGAFALLAPKIREAVNEMGLWATVQQGFMGWLSTTPVGAMLGSGGSPARAGSRPGVNSPGKDINLPVDPAQAMRQQIAAAIRAASGGGSSKDAERAAKEAERAAKEWQKFKDDMSGQSAVNEAEKWMKALEEIGGLTHMTADAQKRLNGILADGLEAYIALGGTAPQAMFDTWLRTALPPVQSGFGIGEKLPGQALKPMTGTDALLAGYGNTMPVGSSIAGIGQSLPLPTAPAPPGFLESAFGGMQNFGANLSSTIMQAITGGGSVGEAIGGLFGGSLFGKDGLGGKLGGMVSGLFGKDGIGGMLGGALGSLIPGIGTLIGSMIGPLIGKIGGALSKLFGRGDDGDKERDAFQDSFGGFNKLGAELSKLGAEGERLFQQLQRADSGKEVQAAADQITKALEAHAKAIDGITEGVNARSKNITGQADLDVVGAGTTAAFALMIQQGKSAIEAFNALTPSITAMRDALAAGNLTASESVARMLEIGAVLDANKIQFENIAASGQILSAMLQGNIRDAGLFGAVAGDIGTQIQTVIDKGVPMAQVFALAQPQLQAIWEAQQKWGFAVDETTQALLTEAEAQGFVGAQMQSVNQQILNVLIAIGNVLGADIPAALGALPGHAQNAANGMQAAFDGIKGPDIGGGGWMPGDPVPVADYGANAPQMASGGIVRARPGGTLVNVGEGGRDEAIVPLGSSLAGMGGRELHLSVDGDVFARVFLPYMTSESQRLGVS
jgi:TP901 family phage tail tape measure protein